MKINCVFNLIFLLSGLQDSDEEDIENDLDEQIETLMAAKRIVREVQASTLVHGSSGAAAAANVPSKTATDKLELAKRLASRINLTKQTPGPAPVVPEASIGAISVIIHLFVWVHFKIPDILFF